MPSAGLDAVLVAVELALEAGPPGKVSVEHPEFDTYDTQVIDSYRTSIKTADYKKGLVRSVGVG